MMQNCTAYPDAVACIRGGDDDPSISGRVCFYQKPRGVLVAAEIAGLPCDNESGFFAFHIHEGGSCRGEDFSDTKGHYNPNSTTHPQHAGDLPPLLSAGGHAFLSVITDRFCVKDILGRTVVIHSGPDDFHTQPAGNAGKKIACGVIKKP